MKQTFTKESIFKYDGEIIIRDPFGLAQYTTREGKGGVTLPRKAFVKPVDVEELASDIVNDHYNYLGEYDFEIFKTGFLAGYKSNPNEFTREEVERLMIKASVIALSWKEVDTTELIDSILPLSVPASVTIENNQVIEVKWA